MYKGTQIVYVKGYESHEGFITEFRGDYAMCKFWSKQNPSELRTKSCSELVPLKNLRIKRTRPQKVYLCR